MNDVSVFLWRMLKNFIYSVPQLSFYKNGVDMPLNKETKPNRIEYMKPTNFFWFKLYKHVMKNEKGEIW